VPARVALEGLIDNDVGGARKVPRFVRSAALLLARFATTDGARADWGPSARAAVNLCTHVGSSYIVGGKDAPAFEAVCDAVVALAASPHAAARRAFVQADGVCGALTLLRMRNARASGGAVRASARAVGALMGARYPFAAAPGAASADLGAAGAAPAVLRVVGARLQPRTVDVVSRLFRAPQVRAEPATALAVAALASGMAAARRGRALLRAARPLAEDLEALQLAVARFEEPSRLVGAARARVLRGHEG